VDLGSVVRRGQVVAQVEPQDYKLRVQQSEAALQQSRVRLGLAPEGDDERVDPEKTGTVRQARAVLEQERENRKRVVALVEQGVARLYAGRIVRLSPVINQQNRVLVVEAEIANPGSLRPGGFAHAEIVTNSGDTAVTVPASAVVTFAGIEKVITVENGKAKEK